MEEGLFRKTREYIAGRDIRTWNMDDLSREVGITKRTLYKKIESKEKLIDNILLDEIRKNRAAVLDILTSEAPYLSRLYRGAQRLPELLAGVHSPFYRSVFLAYPDIEEKVIRLRRDFFARFGDFLGEGVGKGFLLADTDPSLVIESIQALVIYFLKSGELEKAGRGIEMIIRGILSDAPRRGLRGGAD